MRPQQQRLWWELSKQCGFTTGPSELTQNVVPSAVSHTGAGRLASKTMHSSESWAAFLRGRIAAYTTKRLTTSV